MTGIFLLFLVAFAAYGLAVTIKVQQILDENRNLRARNRRQSQIIRELSKESWR